MNEFFATLDKAHGVPDDRSIPSQVKVDWCRWAHEKTMNAGYNANDSHKWLLERELDWKTVDRGTPLPAPRQQFDHQMDCFHRIGQSQMRTSVKPKENHISLPR
eukprot:5327468-Amphidinium_carterae.2